MHQFAVEPAGGQWQLLRVALDGPVLSRGDWYAPKLVSFSMAVETREGRVDIRKVSLTASGAAGAGAVELLQNGDFSQELAHWFFTSDSHHLPWHLESMVLGVLFDQGAVGLALWAALYAGAFWRVSVGSARAHTLAPPIAGALAGVFVVGLFSSVLDVSRVAFLIDLLVLLGLTVRVRSSPARHGGAEFPNDFTVARSALGAAGSAGEFRSMPASPMPTSRPRASAMTPASPAWHPAPRTSC